MSNTITNLRRKINGAKDLRSVVRTMKAVAASNLGQFENSVRALLDYSRTLEWSLGLCFRKSGMQQIPNKKQKTKKKEKIVRAVVFGSDQGLVGQFNDLITDYAIKTLTNISDKSEIWAVGERAYSQLELSRLTNSRLSLIGLFAVPNSVRAISPLIGQILISCGSANLREKPTELHLFYNSSTSGPLYNPVHQKILPLDQEWQDQISQIPWPSSNLAETLGDNTTTLQALIREYLFISLFRACAESLACENASRLAAMQRADKNIDELLDSLNSTYHQLRQSGIDEELFDIISGFEAAKLSK